jgi:hypothetical protein
MTQIVSKTAMPIHALARRSATQNETVHAQHAIRPMEIATQIAGQIFAATPPIAKRVFPVRAQKDAALSAPALTGIAMLAS